MGAGTGPGRLWRDDRPVLRSALMDFALSDELLALQETCRRIARDKVKPRAREIDETGEYPQDLFEVFRDAGLLGLCIPEDLGGSGAGILGLTIAIEEVAKYSNTAALMLLLTRLPTGPVMIAGSPDQNQRYIAPIADGSKRAAFCLSEPQAGSDVMGMRTKAVRDGDEWVINGTKCWISGVVQADWYTVFAKTSDDVTARNHDAITAFIVERSWDGVEVAGTDRKMGVRGVDTGELLLSNVRVPAANVIGEIGGFQLAMQGLNSMRPIVAARGIGLAEGAREAVEHVARLAVVLLQAVLDQADDDVVGHEAAGIHDLLGLEAQRGARLHRGAQHVAGRDLRNAELLLDEVGLRTLAGARRSQKNQSHTPSREWTAIEHGRFLIE